MQIDSILGLMPNVQIRNVPEDVHRRLKVEAAQSGRSLNEYLLARLTEIAERPTLIELAERTQARGPVEGVTMDDIVRAIHEGREGR
jgi:plasmid stability protein